MPSGAGDIPLEYFTTMPFDSSIVVATPGALSELICNRAANLAEMLMVPVMGVVENFAPEGSTADTLGLYPVIASIAYKPEIRERADSGSLGSYDCEELEFFARMLADTL